MWLPHEQQPAVHTGCYVFGGFKRSLIFKLSFSVESASGFLTYVAAAIVATVLLIWVTPPEWGTTNIFIYVSICSLVGSLSVVSCKVGTQKSVHSPDAAAAASLGKLALDIRFVRWTSQCADPAAVADSDSGL